MSHKKAHKKARGRPLIGRERRSAYLSIRITNSLRQRLEALRRERRMPLSMLVERVLSRRLPEPMAAPNEEVRNGAAKVANALVGIAWELEHPAVGQTETYRQRVEIALEKLDEIVKRIG